MSSGGKAALALALGAGGGYLVWHLTKKDAKKPGGGGAPAATAPPPANAATLAPAASSAPPSAPGAPSSAASPIPVEAPPASWPCALNLDGAGLTVNGARADVPTAVARCKTAGRAELALAGSAPAALHAQLAYELFKAGVPLQTRAA